MKDIKSKKLILTLTTVFLLIFSAYGSFGISIDSANDRNLVNSTNINIKSSPVKIQLESQLISTKSIILQEDVQNKINIQSFNNSENIVVVNTLFKESHPSMVVYGRDCLVAYEHEIDGYPFTHLKRSEDYGQNWTYGISLELEENNEEIYVNSPALCINPKGEQAYGAFLSTHTDTGLVGNLIIPDISDLNRISYFVLNYTEATNSYWEFSDPNIVYHYLNNAPWITGYIGSTNFTYQSVDYSCEDSLMFTYQDSEDPNTVWLQWDHKIENCKNLSLTIDEESKNFFGICEKKNGTIQDLLFFKGIYEPKNGNDEPNLNISYNNLTYGIDHKHPEIIIKDDVIYVITETIINGTSKDIIIYHSSNEGETWDDLDPTGNVSAPPGEFFPKFPLISTNTTDIVCTYIEDNDLYITKSKISEISWSDPVRINNVNSSVVDKYSFADMPDNKHIVWTDNRNGNYDLYSISHGVPRLNLMVVPGSLELVATNNPYFFTNNSVKFKVQNTGEDYAEDVIIEVIVNRSGQDPYITKYPGFIKYLKTGAEIELKQPLFEMTLKGYIHAVSDLSEIDFITVEINASSSFQDSDPSDNSDKMAVTFENIFPLLSQHPFLVSIFKLLALVI